MPLSLYILTLVLFTSPCFLDYLLKIITSMKNLTVLKTMDPVFWGEAELLGIFDKVNHSGEGMLLWVCYL